MARINWRSLSEQYIKVQYLPHSKKKVTFKNLIKRAHIHSRYQRPRGLRRRSAAARLLGLWVRFPPVACMYVSCDYCVLSGRDLCVRLTTRPEESECGVSEYDREASIMRRPWSTGGCWPWGKNERPENNRSLFSEPSQTSTEKYGVLSLKPKDISQ
jgi:hypothetical protein